MSADFKRRLPIPMELKEELPLSHGASQRKAHFDHELASIIRGDVERRVLVIGPCSADREDAVLDYVMRLAKLQERVAEKLLLVPRVYTNKPRTKGTGYKGLLHQPNPEAKEDLLEGLKAIRRMHLRVAEETGLFPADEMLYPDNSRFLSDILSYVAIGARSVENQQHRMVASGVDTPVGLKNPTGGSLDVMLNSIYAAQQPQTFIYRNWEVATSGNPLAHAVLRGYIGSNGTNRPNYHYEFLERLLETYLPGRYQNPAVMIDCNHDNSGKRPLEQARICNEVLDSMARNEGINCLVRGFMIESYLEDGSQPVDGGVYGKSITDPCLGWEKSERLVLDIAERL